ncbi:MAG: hypothetical protein VXW59_00300 [Actinomycetota bacterium]|nr:hypothetical protein [Actinomycetota bacterium]MEC7404491.1 hypothetical protein [Actinomycetota bacterium]
MSRPSRRRLLFLAALVLVVGIVGIRALRTTTTEISRAEVVDRYERAVEDGEADDVDEAESTLGADDASGSDASTGLATTSTTSTLPAEPATTGVPLPEPGVYPVALQGGEQLDLATGAERTYPDEGFVTVTPVECGVDIRTDFVVERWQSLEFCETESGIELGTERIFHSFFGLDDLAVRSCTASPVSVDATSWRCESETSLAVRAVTTERVARVVAGEEREVIVFTAELVEGDHPDNVELIELWLDVATGMTVQERRTYDFVLDTPLGDAGYTEEYEWWVTSLEPIG